jgi:hypothetical protein
VANPIRGAATRAAHMAAKIFDMAFLLKALEQKRLG